MRALLHWIDRLNAAHPWSHNDHYIPWILRQVPPGAQRALDVGCGTGTLLRALAGRVLLASRRAGVPPLGMPTAPPRETLREIRAAAPAAVVRRRLFWRYTLVEDAAPR